MDFDHFSHSSQPPFTMHPTLCPLILTIKYNSYCPYTPEHGAIYLEHS